MAEDAEGVYIMYFDEKSKARWQFKTSDGRIVADSSVGYDDIGACSRDIRLMRRSSNAPFSITGLMKRRGRPIKHRKARNSRLSSIP